MTAGNWEEMERLLSDAAELDGRALDAWRQNAPAELRDLLGADLEFGSWAADAAVRLLLSGARLAVPSDLGHYRILRHLATGGMGDVYEAEDPRLKRRVAVKVLHAGAIRRLDEEAEMLARLRHPNICRIYDVGRAAGVEYFVMELLDGVPLSERLRKGALPTAEALSIGRALAGALAEAHRIGIVHRDVKPANILLTRSGTSLVDFGIAGAAAAGGAIAAGTPPYMAPEQARGLCDPRSDIYSLGAVLREMTGDAAPEPVRNVIASCLREDPDERWQSAADLARALEWMVQPVRAAAPAPWWQRWWIGYAAAALVATGAILWVARRPEKPRSHVMFPLRAPRNHPIRSEGQIAISPDATRVAFVAPGDTPQTLVWIRSLSESTAEPISGSAGAGYVFWAPDGQSIGFMRGELLEARDLKTGAVRTLARTPGPALRVVWSEDGQILYSNNDVHGAGVIYRVAATGGTLQRLTSLNSAEEELRQGFQVALRGGEKFLFVAGSNRLTTFDEPGQTYLSSFRNPEQRKLLLRGAIPAGAAGNRVYYVRESKLWSRRLDVTTGEWQDEPRLEAAGVNWAKVTSSGAVIYMPLPENSRPAWVDRQGFKLGEVPVPEGQIIGVGLSRDGTALITRQEEQSLVIGLWVARGQQAQRIGSGPGRYIGPHWSGDGKWIYFAAYDGTGLHRRLPVPGAQEELLLPRNGEDTVISTSTRDGRYGFCESIASSRRSGFDIFRFDLVTRERREWAATEANEGHPALSPDDRWIAWLCGDRPVKVCISPREDSRRVLYVVPLPAAEPQWSRDGRELYFASRGSLYSMPISIGGGKVVDGAPVRLFALPEWHRLGPRYAVESANRFLVRDIYRPAPDPVLLWDRPRD